MPQGSCLLFDAQVGLLRLRNNKNLMIELHTFRDTNFNTDDPFVNEIARGGVKFQIS